MESNGVRKTPEIRCTNSTLPSLIDGTRDYTRPNCASDSARCAAVCDVQKSPFGPQQRESRILGAFKAISPKSLWIHHEPQRCLSPPLSSPEGKSHPGLAHGEDLGVEYLLQSPGERLGRTMFGTDCATTEGCRKRSAPTRESPFCKLVATD
jgi:hypothetical protein